MTDLRGGNSHGSSNGFCLRVHDGAIVVGFRFHRTDRGETAASLRTGQRPKHLIAPINTVDSSTTIRAESVLACGRNPTKRYFHDA